jgi:hypothetical protein
MVNGVINLSNIVLKAVLKGEMYRFLIYVSFHMTFVKGMKANGNICSVLRTEVV